MVHWTLYLTVRATLFVVFFESNLILCLLSSALHRPYSSVVTSNFELFLNKRGNGDSVDISQKMVHLLEKMVKTKKFPGSIEFQFDDIQIDEKIKQYKIDLSIRLKDTNLLLLRVAIAAGRRDVCRVLLKHGALPLDSDGEGAICSLISTVCCFYVEFKISI